MRRFFQWLTGKGDYLWRIERLDLRPMWAFMGDMVNEDISTVYVAASKRYGFVPVDVWSDWKVSWEFPLSPV